MARFTGWYVAHFRPATSAKGWRTPVAYDGKGFPDLVLCRDRIIFAELKADRGKLRPDQDEWARRLTLANAEWYLWTPREWVSGAIDSILSPATTVAGLAPPTTPR